MTSMLESGNPLDVDFGPFGGRFVPETLVPALLDLEAAAGAIVTAPAFRAELQELLATYVGRPTPLHRARGLERSIASETGVACARIYLKREDLCHTGSHKLNNAIGQALLARRMGRGRVIAETGAGQHGVATATACALLGLSCHIYMGAVDMERQPLNVERMRLLGARLIRVEAGGRTLKEATSAAIRAWMACYRDTYYLIGSVVGPQPYPALVRHFQRVIGDEARAQLLENERRVPDVAVACVGGGSNASGLFNGFLQDASVELVGVEAGGIGAALGQHSATLSLGRTGVLHGAMSYVLQDPDGQIAGAHSIAAGLDYPGVGPEHAWLREQGRARYAIASDADAHAAWLRCARAEGIIPALESAHALAWALERSRVPNDDAIVLVCLSGRGDKDVGRDLALAKGDTA